MYVQDGFLGVSSGCWGLSWEWSQCWSIIVLSCVAVEHVTKFMKALWNASRNCGNDSFPLFFWVSSFWHCLFWKGQLIKLSRILATFASLENSLTLLPVSTLSISCEQNIAGTSRELSTPLAFLSVSYVYAQLIWLDLLRRGIGSISTWGDWTWDLEWDFQYQHRFLKPVQWRPLDNLTKACLLLHC